MTRRHVILLVFVGSLARPALGQEAPRSVESHGPALFDEPALLTAAIEFPARFSSGVDGGATTGFIRRWAE